MSPADPDPITSATREHRERIVHHLLDVVGRANLAAEVRMIMASALGEAFDYGLQLNRIDPLSERIAAPTAWGRLRIARGFLQGLADVARNARGQTVSVSLESLTRAIRAIGELS